MQKNHHTHTPRSVRLIEGRTVEEIVVAADLHCGAVNMAQERAEYGNWPEPKTPADYLAWIEDEAEVQEAAASNEDPVFREGTLIYAALLRDYAQQLRDVGVKPTLLPWKAAR